jgi:uncharacterized hydrophobic protein (TIGR00271 family)
MVHLRIVAPPDRAPAVLERLSATASVYNVIRLPGAASRPDGDAIFCDVAREDASVVIAGLKDLGIASDGSIALEAVDTAISRWADAAQRHAPGSPADAVVWEEVEEHTSENVELSGVFLLFMVLAGLIAALGIFEDSAILIVGAMVVGPEFGPIAGLCVALVTRRPGLAGRSFLALAAGFPLAMAATFVASVIFRATGLTADEFVGARHQISSMIAEPSVFAALVALCAGAAGMLSLSTAKSGALIGVLISVTTIPAAADVGVAAAYGDWPTGVGSLAVLGINTGCIVVAGTTVLGVQRALYARRRHREEMPGELARR